MGLTRKPNLILIALLEYLDDLLPVLYLLVYKKYMSSSLYLVSFKRIIGEEKRIAKRILKE